MEKFRIVRRLHQSVFSTHSTTIALSLVMTYFQLVFRHITEATNEALKFYSQRVSEKSLPHRFLPQNNLKYVGRSHQENPHDCLEEGLVEERCLM
ncbi:hypothetical protein AVEN_248494-1 [Araneus ventricosus]|uniref:Uncharacterized protein n=1 Tax=Araneus ventricosus TaxID=182803 RepID=A0A4Y2DXQ1_ARAVE|nr:hypothetical protein AVEN_248494-1 [Araneus ventricosus]